MSGCSVQIIHWIVGQTDLDKRHRFWLDGSDSLSSSVQERLGHRRLISALDSSVQPVISRLKGHLHEGIRTEAVSLDEVRSVAGKLQGLRVVLADQVGNPRLGISDPSTQIGSELPL